MAELIQTPYPVFLDIDGTPLDDGFIFIGEPGLDPETNPLQAYWDLALTVPANNIRTKSGYPFNGTYPARLYIGAAYSILVKNKREVITYAQQDSVVSASSTNITWTAGTTAGPICNSSTGTDEAIPSASGSASGAITTGAQTLAGVKTFGSIPVVPDNPVTDSNIGAVTGNNVFDFTYPQATIDGKITGSTDQIAKAWVNFNGTGTVAIRDSFNVSSISDLGTGIYQVNITNAMDDTNYIAVFSGGDSSTNQGRIMSTGATPTTSTYTVKTSDHAGNFEDWAYCNLVIYG